VRIPFTNLEIKLQKNTASIASESLPLVRRLMPWGYYGSTGLPTETDFTAQLNAYKSWVYVASSMNATSVAQVPLRLYVAKPSKDIKSRFPTKELDSEQIHKLLSQEHIRKLPQVRKSVGIEEVTDHPVLDMIRNVNSFCNNSDLWETTQLYQELTGNGYWFVPSNKLGVPQEIWMIPPDRMKIVPDPEKFIANYLYSYGAFNYQFSEQDIIHFKMVNPRSQFYGTSPFMSIVEQYGIALDMNKYEKTMFKNMGRLSGNWVTEDSLDQEDFDRLKIELVNAHGGVDNIGKAPLTDKGLKYIEYGKTPVEMAYIEGRKINQEEILNAFGQTLGLYTATATRANAEAAQVQYARRALKPRCTRNAEKLNEKLVPKFSPYLFFNYDDPTPEDVLAATKERSENIRTGALTLNEARAKMRMPPYPKGGDEPLIQSQYTTLSNIVKGANIVKPPTQVEVPNQDKPTNDNVKPVDEDKPIVSPKKSIDSGLSL
jgi:HK97 family phage portal protein